MAVEIIHENGRFVLTSQEWMIKGPTIDNSITITMNIEEAETLAETIRMLSSTARLARQQRQGMAEAGHITK